jgi:hypothetical protein
MDDIAPGLIDYRAFHRGIGMTVHSHYVVDPGVLIDPMAAQDPLPGAPRLAVLTNRHHLRHATRFGCPIVCHEAGLHEFEGTGADVDGFAWGDELAPGVRALEVGVLCPEESALHIAVGDGYLAFADAIVRDGDGCLAFVGDSLLGDDAAAVRGGLRDVLGRLLVDEDFDGLLLAHGAPTSSGGRAELQAFVSSAT